MTKLSWTTIVRLWWAGWRQGRDVWNQTPLPANLAVFPEAKRVLTSFGGLRFGDRNEHVFLNPCAAIEEDNTLLNRCETAVGRRLYPVGYQEHQDREPIFLDEEGNVYINFGESLYLIANSFEAALNYLVRTGSGGGAACLKRSDHQGWNVENGDFG